MAFHINLNGVAVTVDTADELKAILGHKPKAVVIKKTNGNKKRFISSRWTLDEVRSVYQAQKKGLTPREAAKLVPKHSLASTAVLLTKINTGGSYSKAVDAYLKELRGKEYLPTV